jgi:glutamate racemase
LNKHILVFDSGLGGTTILQELQKKLPDCNYSYALDNGAFPYSNKSDEFLMARMLKLFDYLIPRCQPDLVVIACNTASTLILEHLRNRFSIPFVGVVPAIKPAAALSKTRVLGLLATQATINRDYIDQLSTAHAEHCEIVRLGSQKLVEIAENKIQGKAINPIDIKMELEQLRANPLHQKIDVFILGCTHFPAISEELAAAWPHPAQWIDSGEAIARRVADLCQQLPEQLYQQKIPTQNTLYLTAIDKKTGKLKTLKRFGINHCHIIEID